MVEESEHMFQCRAKRVIQAMTEFCKDQIEIIGGVSPLLKAKKLISELDDSHLQELQH
jgi:hypothetical protein